MANHHAPGREAVNETVHHEESDVNIRAIFGFGLGLLIVGIVVHVAVLLLFRYFSSGQEAANSVRQYPLAAGQENRLPPEPRLQTNPRQDLLDLRAQEDQLLKGYSWVDRNAGVVRIPIDDAMKLVVQRGLPARGPQQPGQQPAAGPAPAPSAQASRPAQRGGPAQPQGRRR
ncbi:MAG TPA: hypothetical protein VH417_17365 [Vicinamibacterales bacterium]|jgi:hypothetical protein